MPIKANGGISAFFCLFGVFIMRTSHTVLKENVFVLEKNMFLTIVQQVCFLGEMSLRIIAALLKNALVLLNCLKEFLIILAYETNGFSFCQLPEHGFRLLKHNIKLKYDISI